MHRSLTSVFAAGLSFVVAATTSTAWSGGPGAIDDARSRLGRSDARGAVEILEAALPVASPSDKPGLLDTLRQAYLAAARQAEAEGKTAEADGYRENFEILQRKPRPVPASDPPPAAIPLPNPKTAVEAKAFGPRTVEPADPSEPLPPLPAAIPLGEPPVLAPPAGPALEKPLPTPDQPIPLPAPRSRRLKRFSTRRQ